MRHSAFILLLLLIAGLAFPLGIAPYFYWPITLCSLFFLVVFLQRSTSTKQAFLYAWVFSLGKFLAGVSWVYVSIHDHSQTPAPLAVIMVGLFAGFLALFPAFCFAAWRRWFYSSFNWLAIAVVWFLSEWLRTWLFTGFPWLFAGDAHLFSWLSGLAPVIGSLGLSFISVLSVNLIIETVKTRQPFYLLGLLIWPLALGLKSISWTEGEQVISTRAIQGNVALNIKWKQKQVLPNIQTYFNLTEKEFAADLVLWPETAITLWADQFEPYLESISEEAKKTNTAIITGIPYRHPLSSPLAGKMHNSIIATGSAQGLYHKQKLVPFGEFVPFESQLRGLIPFFDIEMSSFLAGKPNQPLLQASYVRDNTTYNYQIAPYICYEIAYPLLVAEMAKESQLLVTISNDAWFGDSLGPKQHMGLAQMRALETGRYLVRATNTGITGMVDDKGNIIERIANNITGTAKADVVLKQGQTPFMRFGIWPLMLLSLFVLLVSAIKNRKEKKVA